MSRIHINPVTGNPGECSAVEGNCPFGGDENHFGSKEEARDHYARIMEDQTIPASTMRDAVRENLIAKAEVHALTSQGNEAEPAGLEQTDAYA